MSDTNSSDSFQTIFVFLCWAYGIMSQIMTIVFWIQYIKTDNIVIAILIDPFIAEIKGLLWPFFI